MANLSKVNRDRMLGFLEDLRTQNGNDNVVTIINHVESELMNAKYGLVWEEHQERVDEEMMTQVPVFKNVPNKEITADPSLPYNFILEGDNLHSLYLLEKTHKGKIDFIYIDPPYNRGSNDFVYDDKFVGEEDNFRHSKWLSFMFKRLSIAFRLLHEEGVIFISIDDNEMAQLKMLCDSIFGDRNALGVMIQNKGNSKNDRNDIQKNHEYILVYRKQANYVNGKEKPTLAEFSPSAKQVHQHGEKYYVVNDPITTRGEGGVLSARPNLGYTVYHHPQTGDICAIYDYDVELAKVSNDENEVYADDKDLIAQGYIPVRPPRVRGKLGSWTWDLKKFSDEKHRIVIHHNDRTGTYSVKSRTFVDKSDVYERDGKLWWDAYNKAAKSVIEFSTNDGSRQLARVLGVRGKFNNPKNVEMIKHFLKLFPKRDAVVLDFFAGSGTTGQAVLELNREDLGTRKFILCTNNQNQICEEVTYPRVRNVIEGYPYEGTDDTILFEKSLTLKDLQEADRLLDELREVEELNKTRFTKIITKLENKSLKVIGQRVYGGQVEGIPANLLYYRTEYISKIHPDSNITERLLEYVQELIQLEHATKIDDRQYVMVLSDEEADTIENQASRLQGCQALFVSSDVLLTKRQEALLIELGVQLITVPHYYFEHELREVGEA